MRLEMVEWCQALKWARSDVTHQQAGQEAQTFPVKRIFFFLFFRVALRAPPA
jgi:hypothetical protein